MPPARAPPQAIKERIQQMPALQKLAPGGYEVNIIYIGGTLREQVGGQRPGSQAQQQQQQQRLASQTASRGSTLAHKQQVPACLPACLPAC